MLADADLATIAALIGDRRRAGILLALMGGQELPAHELAARVGASSSLASAHLTKLLAGGLLSADRRGRERYYRIADQQTAQALEGLLAIAPGRAARTLRESRRGEAIRHARTCYDHLAGELGVGLTEALQHQHLITAHDAGYTLTAAGETRLQALGIDVTAARRQRRAFARQCVDWTHRRPHLAGALGATIAEQLLALNWLRRIPNSRALVITPSGKQQLRTQFALEFG
jgi:DNA-binding transcriptional ArsR family regulator